MSNGISAANRPAHYERRLSPQVGIRVTTTIIVEFPTNDRATGFHYDRVIILVRIVGQLVCTSALPIIYINEQGSASILFKNNYNYNGNHKSLAGWRLLQLASCSRSSYVGCSAGDFILTVIRWC